MYFSKMKLQTFKAKMGQIWLLKPINLKKGMPLDCFCSKQAGVGFFKTQCASETILPGDYWGILDLTLKHLVVNDFFKQKKLFTPENVFVARGWPPRRDLCLVL